MDLLKTPAYRNLKSIIIYVMRQRQADLLSTHIKTRKLSVASYHAGKSPKERTRIQNSFMKGKVQILIATIAFGMGINKSDVRGIIHFDLPKSLENYVQEIGRAGRDGNMAWCHLFLSKDDYMRMRSLSFSDGVDHPSIHRLLLKLLKHGTPSVPVLSLSSPSYSSKSGSSKNQENQTCTEQQESNLSLDRKRNRDLNESVKLILNISSLEQELDMKREILETLLRYMEMDEKPLVKLISSKWIQ